MHQERQELERSKGGVVALILRELEHALQHGTECVRVWLTGEDEAGQAQLQFGIWAVHQPSARLDDATRATVADTAAQPARARLCVATLHAQVSPQVFANLTHSLLFPAGATAELVQKFFNRQPPSIVVVMDLFAAPWGAGLLWLEREHLRIADGMG